MLRKWLVIFLLSFLLIGGYLSYEKDQKLVELNVQELHLSELRSDRISMEVRNKYIEQKIDGLSGQFIDYDLLEEEVRRVLHYKEKGDLVLKTSDMLPESSP